MYKEETANLETMIYDDEEVVGLEPEAASKWQFLWLCGLVLSFCYALPLVIVTTKYRMNPRLYDVFFVIGMLTVFPNLRKISQLPKLFRVWCWIVATFTVCAVIWLPQFPWFYGKYIVYWLAKYFEGLLAIYMVVRIPLTSQQKKIMHYLVVVGGIVVACYAIPQYLRGGAGPIYIPRAGKELVFRAGTLTSCLTPGGYLHVAIFSTMASVMTLAFYHSLKSTISKLLCLGLGVFVSWPAFFCGARAGLVGPILAWGYLFLVSKASFKAIIIVLMLFLSLFTLVYTPKMLSPEYLSEKSLSIERFLEAEEGTAKLDIRSRFTLDWYQPSLYRWQGWRIPFIGAGFMVAPHTYPDGMRKYRVGYGIHNAYLFALEQGGVAAFILFIVFLFYCWKALSKARRSTIADDVAFATGVQAFFFSQLFIAFSGPFLLMEATGDFCSHLIILIVIAVKTSVKETDEYYSYELDYADDF